MLLKFGNTFLYCNVLYLFLLTNSVGESNYIYFLGKSSVMFLLCMRKRMVIEPFNVQSLKL